MSTYRLADRTVHAFVEDVMHRYHRDLVENDVTVEVLFAHGGDGPAITHQGWPAMALVKINPQKERAAGLKDARIVVDGDRWEDWDDRRRTAIIDHELQHLRVQRDKWGGVKTDACNRPLLEMREHDWQFGGFDTLVRRHGINSVEAQSVASVKKRLDDLVQGTFDWDGAEASSPVGYASTAGV